MKQYVDIAKNSHPKSAQGESYSSIFRLMLPEYITSLVLYSMPFFIDAYFIGSLASTPSYTALTGTNNVLHLFVKIAEGFSVGTVIVAGMLNGAGAYDRVGRAAKDSFWVMTFLGVVFSVVLFLGAGVICCWYSVPADVLPFAVPYLRIRALGVFLTFISLAFLGFLRSVKNTHAPMKIFFSGAVVFLLCDYALIFGAWGLPQLGLMGSAWAAIIQYSWILLISVLYSLYSAKNLKYRLRLFEHSSNERYFFAIVRASLPVIVDKSIMALAYIWLGCMINQLGSCAAASFGLIKDMERFAFLPAIACAHVVTFLVSNEIGRRNWEAAMANVRRLTCVAFVGVFGLLAICILKTGAIAGMFDKAGAFTEMAQYAFPLISILVVCDLLQLILSGALRGAGKTTIVMLVRALVCICYFLPVSFLIRHLPIDDCTTKFVLIYGSFYVGNGIMSFIYLRFFDNPFVQSKSV